MYQTIFSGSIITKEGKVRMLYLYSFQFNLLHIFFLILFYLTNSKKYVTSQLREGIASNYCSVKKNIGQNCGLTFAFLENGQLD